MSDLRTYINLISEVQSLNERVRFKNKNKNKNNRQQGQRPQTPATPKTPPISTPAAKGSVLRNIIKNNPKTAKALGLIAGLSAIPYVSDKVRQPTTPDTGGQPAGSAGSSSRTQQSPSQDDIAALKAKIDAMIKELETSTDPQVKKELERIKQKLSGATTNSRTGQPQPNYSSTTGSARDYYNRSINFIDRLPNQ